MRAPERNLGWLQNPFQSAGYRISVVIGTRPGLIC
jgi:hypothetical protein